MLAKLFLLLVLPFTLAQKCKDDPYFTWDFEWQGETLTHHCSFLTNSNNPDQNKKRQNNWCGERVGRNDVLIKNKCKKACDNCPDDDDSGSGPCHNHHNLVRCREFCSSKNIYIYLLPFYFLPILMDPIPLK